MRHFSLSQVWLMSSLTFSRGEEIHIRRRERGIHKIHRGQRVDRIETYNQVIKDYFGIGKIFAISRKLMFIIFIFAIKSKQSNTAYKIRCAWATSQKSERHRINRVNCKVFWQRLEWNLLGTLLMARSGRRTRTVLIADRLTLCPSSEYSSILQKSKKPLLCHWNYDQPDLGKPWTSVGNPAENSAPSLGYRDFSYQSLRSTSLRTKWCHCHSTELYTLTPPTPTHTLDI